MVDILALLLELPVLLSVVIFIALFLLQTLLVTFPTYVLMFYGGLRFGIWWGTLINIAGMIATTSFGYVLGLLGKLDGILEHPSMQKFKEQVDERGISAVGFLRLIPILPYNVTSIGSGLVKINWRRYFIINNLALLPYTIIWAFLGDYFGDALLSRITVELSWRLVIPSLIFLSILVLTVRYLKRRYADHQG